MDAMEEKLNTILNDPKMMQQIMSLAQSLGNTAESGDVIKENSPASIPDLSGLQKLSGLVGQGNIDSNQKQLLTALTPYLSSDRVSKLENAMRAAKLARMASAFLGNDGLKNLSGR